MLSSRSHSIGGVDELGDINAPIGSPARSKAAHQKALVHKHDTASAAMGLRSFLKELHNCSAWKDFPDRHGELFSTWEDYCQYPEPLGLGMRMADVEAILAEPEGSKRTLAAVLGTRGGDRKSQEFKDQADAYPVERRQYGTSRKDTLARLRRDDPELAERVEAGELTANAAAVEKGWRKPTDPYKQLCAAWRRASADQRNAFEDYIAAYRRKDAA